MSAPPQERKEKAPVEIGSGVVKAVPSGDRIQIYVNKKSQSAVWSTPEEREIKISSIKAPLLGAKGDWGTRKEEPFAWQSREYLRELLIGQTVKYKIDSQTDKRAYGTVLLTPNDDDVAQLIVSEGWAEVSRPKGADSSNTTEGDAQSTKKRERTPKKEVQELIDLETKAKELGKGKWTQSQEEKEHALPTIDTDFDAVEFYKSSKGKTLTGIVEHVFNGSMLRILLLPSFREIVLKVGGVQAPTSKRGQKEEPFFKEAQWTTERHLLNRKIQVNLTAFERGKTSKKEEEGGQNGQPSSSSGNSTYHGEVLWEGKSIGELLLSAGLATFVPWSAPKDKTAHYAQLQLKAQEAKKRMWSSDSVRRAAQQTASQQSFIAKVQEVTSGNQISVLNLNVNPPVLLRNLTLSSISVPRLGKNDKPDEAFAWEAREFVRKRLMGKRVQVSLDYVKPEQTVTANGSEGGAPSTKGKEKEASGKGGKGGPLQKKVLPAKPFYTITHDGKNIALALVEVGYAKVIETFSADKSQYYDSLFLAQERAREKKLGLWGDSSKFTKHYLNDVSRNPKKAKQIYQTLSKKGDERLDAIVEYVFSGSRVKLCLPKENLLITFFLAGCRSENLPNPAEGKPAPPFAVEARDFTRDFVLNYDVQVQIDGQDKHGAFKGYLWRKGKSLSVLLLEQGLAQCNRPTLYADEYEAAEAKAKAERKGVWKDFDPVKEAAERQKRKEEVVAASQPRKEVVHVTEVLDGGSFYVQLASEENGKLKQLMEQIAALGCDDKPAYKPKAPEEVVLAKFAEDNTWYRAKVLNVSPAECTVLFGDYGNTDVVPVEDIRTLPAELGLKALKWQAQPARLAFIEPRGLDKEWGEEAAHTFRDLVWGKTIIATIEYKDSNTLYLSLLAPGETPQQQIFVNGELVKAGLARVEKRLPRGANREIVSHLRAEEADAHKNHRGLWEYGADAEDDPVD
ncbi:nuclease domain-containing protein [Balamuthia mandrillaris]